MYALNRLSPTLEKNGGSSNISPEHNSQFDAMYEATRPPKECPKTETLSLITSSINLIMSFPISIKLYFSLLKELYPCP